MFLCVSPNPAIDKRVRAANFSAGAINRADSVEAFPGGKSAHVAMVLRTLGESPAWIGPTGGAAGHELIEGLRALGIDATSFPIANNTRTNLEIIDAAGKVTELLEPGPVLSASEEASFIDACSAAFARGADRLIVIFSGSLPASVPPHIYATFISAARKHNCRTLLDTGGAPLKAALAAQPDFVKPNRDETQQLLGAQIDSLAGAANAVRQLIRLGARSAALTLGAEGILFAAGNNQPVYFLPAVPLHPLSTVGCGDSALAGFAQSFERGASPHETLRLAAACAAANCLAPSPGAARRSDIDAFLEKLPLTATEIPP